MKVLHLAQYIYSDAYPEFQRSKTGLGIMVADICCALSKKDEVYLFTHAITRGHKDEYVILKHSWGDILANLHIKDVIRGARDAFGVKTSVGMKFHLFYYAINCGALRKIIRTVQPEMVHVHEYTPSMKNFILLCDELHIPYIVTCHGLLYEKKCDEYIKNCEKQMMQKCQIEDVNITTISSSIKKKLIEQYNLTKHENLHVILNGTECNEISTIESDKIALVDELISRGKKILLCVGQLSERKNQEQVVRAVNLLEEKSDIAVVFVGNDTLDGKIQKMVIEQGLEDICIYVGFVNRNELGNFYLKANATIVASIEEGFGLPMIESFSYGRPVLTFSDLDAIADIYSEKAMILVEDRKDQSLAKGIVDIMRKEWDIHAIKKHAQNFSLECMAQKYHELYRRKINEVENKRMGL